ncbi:MAG TPA: peptide ABC transporter substrate-binding protein [Rhizomicrobium sp.]|jgi:oligopeptide transport system substrate-binding protein|nr:peptide ABC transporter substrate-binding protein [Rhizomicrobium sp.]
MASGKAWNRRLALAGGVAVAAGASALALRRPGNAIHPVADARTFHRGNAVEPETMDSSMATGIQDDAIIGDLAVGLVTEDPMTNPVPGMATSWTMSADGLTWTFYLRQALWSDGTQVTAQDFVFSWRRLLDPATAAPYAYYLYIVKNAGPVNAGKLPATALGVRALDDHSLEIQLEHPAPYLLEMMTHTATYPVPRHVVEAKGRDWARPGNHVGNGAFTLKEWVPNGHVQLVKNPRFYDADNVALERVFFYPTDDYDAALQRMRAGELDIQTRLPAQQIDWIKANMPETRDPVPLLAVEYLEVNHTRKPFDDIRVRQAINLALNREAIAGRIRRVGDVPAYNLVPPATANFPGGNAFEFRPLPYGQRIEKARALMRNAGFDERNRMNTTYMIRSTAPGNQRAVAAAIQQMLAQVYINAAILPIDFQVFLAETHAHNFDMAEAAWNADFNDAATFLELLLTGGGNNDCLYSNRAFDAMVAAAQNDTDLASRGRKLAAAEALILKDQAIMPLYFWADENLVWPYVKGWKANAMDKHRSRWIAIDQQARMKQFA